MKPILVYVVGAYSGDVKKNIEKAEATSINLIRSGIHVITPHKNTAGYEKYEDGLITYNTWMEMDFDILQRCDAIYVMDNGETSNGSKKEIEYAHKLGMPIIYEKDCPSDDIEFCCVCGFPMMDCSNEVEFIFNCTKCACTKRCEISI
jgi:hypothetical protein